VNYTPRAKRKGRRQVLITAAIERKDLFSHWVYRDTYKEKPAEKCGCE